MTFKLRPYQGDMIVETRDALREVNSVLVQCPTGGGKTAIASFMSGSAAKRSKRVVFGCHRRELIKQTAATFDKVGIPYGIIASGVTGDHRQPIQIASIPTLSKRMDWYGTPDLYIPDEAHHAGAKTWADIIDGYSEAGAKIVGLSATPERLDGAGLGKWFSRMVKGPSPAWLMEQGFLSPYELYAPSAPDLEGIKRTGGDFNRAELEKRMGGVSITGNAVEHYRKLAHGRKAMVFCVSIKHSLSVVEQFQAAGYRAAHIDGESDNRDALIAAFEAGRIQVLSSVDLVSEGFDLPAIEVAILLRPTHSLPLFLQQVGRVLRPVYAKGFDLETHRGRLDAIAAGPKPFALILDHAGNSRPKEAGGRGHGLPDDEREWTLEGRKKKSRGEKDDDDGEKVTLRQCPTCYRVHQPAPSCPKCGHEYPTMGRTVEELAGELQKVDPAVARRQRLQEQSSARSFEDLVAIGRMRGMKNPHGWAKHVVAAREKKSTQRYVRA